MKLCHKLDGICAFTDAEKNQERSFLRLQADRAGLKVCNLFLTPLPDTNRESDARSADELWYIKYKTVSETDLTDRLQTQRL